VEGFLARRWLLAGVVLAVIALALVAPAFLLGAAPMLGLVLVLAAGWFPGEKVIARWRDRDADPRRTPARARVIARHRVVRRSSRLLICFSLANRPPPLLLHA
jgi:4-hydroxybenzoate polyprenyltransferase